MPARWKLHHHQVTTDGSVHGGAVHRSLPGICTPRRIVCAPRWTPTVRPIQPSPLRHAFQRFSDASPLFCSGEWIVKHPRILRVSMTGSTNAGKAAMRNAAGELKSITLELGGNDPCIVLPDVDPNEMAK